MLFVFSASKETFEKPHRAVCSEVLNLPSQVGSRLQRSALAEAYRVTLRRLRPH